MSVFALDAAALVALSAWIVLGCLRGGFWRVRLPAARPALSAWPAVLVVIPARNEAEVLPATLPAVLGQDYPGDFAVVLVDDASEDSTAATARRLQQDRPGAIPFEVVAGRPRPAGWVGKVWAQAQGIECGTRLLPHASFLWLTDADIHHPPDTLRALVATAVGETQVLHSQMVRLHCASLAEKALIPAFVFFFAMLYPFDWVNSRRRRSAAAAGGSMLVERATLEAQGGIGAIRGALIDDCALAALLKPAGSIRLELADGSTSLRLYPDFTSIWDMVARSAFTQLRYSVLALVATVAGMVLVYLVPPALVVAWAAGLLASGPAVVAAALAWAVMALLYQPMLAYYRRSPGWGVLLPAVALFYLGATLASAVRHWRGRGGQWKGRAQAALQGQPDEPPR